MSKYIEIHVTEGEVYIREFKNKREFLDKLKSNMEGVDPKRYPKYRSEMPKNLLYESAYYLIKGELIQPKPIEVVTEWDLEED